MNDNPSDEEIKRILTTYKRVAVVGMSKDPQKEAYSVPVYLKEEGFEITPVNPKTSVIAGIKAYKSLSEIPFEFDIVQLFRPSEAVLPFVDEAIKTPAKVVWMQLGISNEVAAEKARRAGKIVVQNRCMKVELTRLVKGT